MFSLCPLCLIVENSNGPMIDPPMSEEQKVKVDFSPQFIDEMLFFCLVTFSAHISPGHNRERDVSPAFNLKYPKRSQPTDVCYQY